MKRLFLLLVLFLLILLLGAGALILRRTDLPSPPVPQLGVARIPEIRYEEDSGRAYLDISVLTYNVAGLPWPAGCGKRSRETDAQGRRIPIACNRASADFMISSPLMDGEYNRLVPDYEGYRTWKI